MKTRKQGGRRFVVPASDLFILGDFQLSSGILFARGDKGSHALTGPAVRAFAQAWFDVTANSLDVLFAQRGELGESDALALAERWLAKQPGVRLSGSKPKSSRITTARIGKSKDITAAGFPPIRLGESGTLKKRKISNRTVYLFESSSTVNRAPPIVRDVTAIQLKPASQILNRLRATVSNVHAESVTCNDCNPCSACGTCVICTTAFMAAAAGANVVGAIAVTSVFPPVPEPDGPPEPDPVPNPQPGPDPGPAPDPDPDDPDGPDDPDAPDNATSLRRRRR